MSDNDVPDGVAGDAAETESGDAVALSKDSSGGQPRTAPDSPAADPSGAGLDTDADSDRQPVAVGASGSTGLTGTSAGAGAGSARAAARRAAAVRAGVTESKGAATRSRDSTRTERPNVFARLRLFLREVVAELRKVIWPARNQMVTYTIVVVVFVVIMVALVAGLDLLFANGVLHVFG